MQTESNEFSVVGHWTGGFDERGLQTWTEGLRGGLRAGPVTLGLVFLTPAWFPYADQVLEILRVHARIPLLAGCSGASLVAGCRELENDQGLVLGLFHLPGAKLTAAYVTQTQVEEANGPGYWHLETDVGAEQTNGWLTFADPFHLDGESWLADWNEAYPGVPTVGGLASGDCSEPRTQVYLNGEVFEEGVVAVSIGGAVRVAGIVSQGCTPIGDAWTITKADGNLIQEIGSRPAYKVLVETFNALPEEQQKRAQGNLFVGLVINEYKEEFHRGDFLIRNVLGGDPKSGILAVGARPRTGQSLQFQCRDAAAAAEDMDALLSEARQRFGGQPIYGGCLCCCNGRGLRLFGAPDHDAALAQKYFGPLGLSGFFCNGEIGPVGNRNFLHGHTASLALFLPK
jgi:small ligand-binding sensory domain FIST